MSIQENQIQSNCGCRELNKNENRNFRNCHKVKRQALSGHKFKELFKSPATKAKTSDFLLGRKDKLFQGDAGVAKSSKGGQVISQKPNKSCKNQSPCWMVCKWKQQSCSNDETQNSHDNLKETPAVVNLNSPIQDHLVHASGSLRGSQIEGEEKMCVTCGHDGQLLCCGGQGCSRSFHLSCIKPSFTYVPPGVWLCIWCIKRKIDKDVYAVSKGIESVLDVMLEVSDNEVTGKQKQKKYLVKYKGLAHIHSRWVPGNTLILECPEVLSRYKQKFKKVSWRKEWCVPQRLLAKRFLVFPDQSNGIPAENNDCLCEWLVKWTGLGYDHATWELENASFLRTPEALKLINDFELLQRKADHSEEDKRRKTTSSELPELPFGCQDHVFHVNKLLEYWHRDQNALVIDNQERIVRVVLFVLTLLKETRSPFLVLTTQNALSIWEAEFSRRGSCAHIVVYKGCRNVRSMIRTLEFYNEKGNIMFQVFLSCYADVAEDIDTFRGINWEVIILDECQHPNMLTHFDWIKLLASNMRLLLVRAEIKDWNFNYHNVLCLLDPQYEGTQKDNLDVHPTSNSSKLKERLLYFTAYDYQSEKIKFVEFWVPAMLTNVQTEQYCASLFSKSMQLCSSLKGDSTGSLRDILVSTRKCCDHPFLVDWSLRSAVLKGIPTADHFDVEIQLSGKLQLLNKILSEIERRGLRVVILFQLLGASGTISVGDILDDFIYQKFGEDRYIRIDGNISHPTKLAACDMFNIKDSEKFICLIETRACTPSIKLSSIDTIIIFNSDWDPLNDIKALERITIDSKFEEMNVFRLYSSCTVEEKALILAKEGVILDIKIKDMKPSICHKLLSWGASYLFRKLDASNEFMASSLETVNTAQQTLLEDVIQELLHLLPRSSGDHNYVECSIGKPSSITVLKVQQNEGTYCGRFSLHGELIVQSKDNFSIVRHLIDTEPPHIFWTNLLEDKQPRWKYMSSPMQRIKRKVKHLDDLLYETENEVPKKKANTDVNARDNQPPKSAFITKKTRSSATKRHTCHVTPSTCAPETRGSASEYDRNVQRHCETLNLSTLTASTNNNNSGTERCSTPDQLPLSSYSMPTGNCAVDVSIAGGIQNGHTNSTKGYACQGQGPLDTSLRGLACLSIHSNCQSIDILAPQLSVTPTDGSLPGAASLGNKNAVDHSGYHLTETSLSTNSPSLKKLMDNMQEGKDKAVVLHNDLELCLESERKKEIEEVNKKYDKLILNAENAIAKTKSDPETCYIKVHEHKLLAEAILQLQKLDQISAAERVKWGGLLPEESQTHRVTNLSAASRCHASPEQDLLELRSTNPAVQVLNIHQQYGEQVILQSSEGPQSSIKTSAGQAQFSADLEINRSAKTPCEPMHTFHPRLPSIRSTYTSRSINSRRQLRAPAPHLRHARPPPAFSALNSNPSAI